MIPGLYYRLSALGLPSAALKGQKAPQFKILPPKCPWTIFSGTQRAECPTIQNIAAEVPLDSLQRHSSGTRQTTSRLCKTNKGAHTAIIGGRDRIILTQPAVELQEINL